MTAEKHVLSMLVDNEPGVLSRIVGLVQRPGLQYRKPLRGGNHGSPGIPDHHRHQGQRPLVEQIEKQLRKLINVIKVRDLTGSGSVQREMALIR